MEATVLIVAGVILALLVFTGAGRAFLQGCGEGLVEALNGGCRSVLLLMFFPPVALLTWGFVALLA
jgi:hypothetical protein